MQPFEYEGLPSRVIIGAGYLDRVAGDAQRLGGKRVFLIHDPLTEQWAKQIAGGLRGTADVRVWGQVQQHVPIDLAEPAREAVDVHGSDLVVSIGGGSSTGLAKAIALSHNLPIVAVPTTYAGSEMTTIYGLTGDRHKQTGKSPQVLPKAVVYDPLLTLGLPRNVTGPSAFNSLAHCVEALYAPGHNPVTSAIALEGVRAISQSLPRVMRQPDDVDARGVEPEVVRERRAARDVGGDEDFPGDVAHGAASGGAVLDQRLDAKGRTRDAPVGLGIAVGVVLQAVQTDQLHELLHRRVSGIESVNISKP